MSETTPTSEEPTREPAPAWRPYGYADPRTGTTEAAGALLRTGPATEAAGGIVPDAGAGSSASWAQRIADEDATDVGADDDDVAQLTPTPGSDVAAAELPAVLVPDDEATRVAESHPNVAAPADAPAGDDTGGAGVAPDVESGELRAGATVTDDTGAAALAVEEPAGAPADDVVEEDTGAAGTDEATSASLVDVEPAGGETDADAGAAAVPPTLVDGAGVADVEAGGEEPTGQEPAGA